MSPTAFDQRFKASAAKILNGFGGKNLKPGATVAGRVTEIGEEPKPKFRGAPGEVEYDRDGNVKMRTFVIVATVAGPRKLTPSWRMDAAIGLALESAGAEFEVGGHLSVTYVGQDPADDRARTYTAVWTASTGQAVS